MRKMSYSSLELSKENIGEEMQVLYVQETFNGEKWDIANSYNLDVVLENFNECNGENVNFSSFDMEELCHYLDKKYSDNGGSAWIETVLITDGSEDFE